MNKPSSGIGLEEMEISVSMAIQSIIRLSTHIIEDNKIPTEVPKLKYSIDDNFISVKERTKLLENKFCFTRNIGGIKITYNTNDDPTFSDSSNSDS